MSAAVERRAVVPALAKVNLDLRVLYKRPDGFHELRSVFHTVSLGDRLEIAFTPGRKTAVELDDALGIPDNLVTRAARLALEAMRVNGRVRMKLTKKTPMGAGMGGGSSDAAAVLLALPALAGRAMSAGELGGLGAQLGSDVPFFLFGGAAAAIGRGTELFPMPDLPAAQGVVIAPGLHVNTAAAYAALSPRLTTESQQNKIFSFQSFAWSPRNWGLACNDFEAVVFEQHPRLAVLKKQLQRLGADVAMMTGSGSAVFGLFSSRDEVSRALRWLAGPSGLRGDEKAFRVSLVSRAKYQAMWGKALAEHTVPGIWPPRSRYTR